MSEKDAVTKSYMQDNAHFADAVNFRLFGGEQVVRPEDLREMDSTVIAIPKSKSGDYETVQRYRDLLKYATIKRDNRAVYLLLGIENQSKMHYAMPVRVMLEDAMQYTAQIRKIESLHRKDGSKPSSAEFLSGFYQEDRLIPVITLTIYFGAEPWTAPTDLHGMLDASPEILKLVDNYHLNLIDPSAIDESDFEKFHTELKNVLQYVKHSNDKSELEEMLAADASFQNITWETANTINVVTGSKLSLPEGKEHVDMCKAIEQWRNETWDEAWGKAWGEAWGEATNKKTVEIAVKMLEAGKLTCEEISEYTGLSIEEVKALAGEKSA